MSAARPSVPDGSAAWVRNIALRVEALPCARGDHAPALDVWGDDLIFMRTSSAAESSYKS